MFKILFTAPLSWIYGVILRIRHQLFDWGILKTEEFDIPIVCVGNITVGGTGKTPHVEYLIDLLKDNYNVAVLSRGYKRKTKGFMLAATNSSFKKIGDEPRQIKLKHPDIPVAVCEKRAEGIKRLRAIHPEINLIILDDAFQHRYVEPWVNIVLMDYSRPVYEDHLLPRGRLRDSRKQLARAQIMVVTKCPMDMRPLDFRIVHKYLEPQPFQSLFFTRFISGPPMPLFPKFGTEHLTDGQGVIAMTGIANPKSFMENIESKYDVLYQLEFPDHYTFKMRDIQKLEKLLKECPENTKILTTEKDGVRLINSKKMSEDLRRRIYFVPIRVEPVDCAEAFNRQIEIYVSKNQKYSLLHPE